MVASAGPSTFAPGAIIPVSIVLTNAGNAIVNLTLDPCSLGFTVSLDDFTPAYNSSAVACSEPPANVSLAPGGTVNRTQDWNQTFANGTAVPASSWYLLGGYLWPCGPFTVTTIPTSLFVGPHGSLLLQVLTTSTRQTVGVSFQARVRLMNIGDTPIQVGVVEGSCNLYFVAFDARGTPVHGSLDGIVCSDIAGFATLDPGQNLTSTYAWDGSGMAPGWYTLVPFAYGGNNTVVTEIRATLIEFVSPTATTADLAMATPP